MAIYNVEYGCRIEKKLGSTPPMPSQPGRKSIETLGIGLDTTSPSVQVPQIRPNPIDELPTWYRHTPIKKEKRSENLSHNP